MKKESGWDRMFKGQRMEVSAKSTGTYAGNKAGSAAGKKMAAKVAPAESDPMEDFMGELSSSINKSAKAKGTPISVKKTGKNTYQMQNEPSAKKKK